MIFVFIGIVLAVAAKVVQRLNKGHEVHIIGEANEFERCPHCLTLQTHLPRGRGEVITRGGYLVVRQHFVCPNCGVDVLWHRRLDQWKWTVDRAGVVDAPYVVHG